MTPAPNPIRTNERPDIAEQMLDAVDLLLGRFGYGKMTLEDVAREAGIGRRTIYLHFPNKQTLALASIDRVVERLLARLEQIADSPGPATERLRRMLVERVLFRFDSVSGYHESLDDLFAELRKPYLERRQSYFEGEEAVFARVMQSGIVGRNEAQYLAHIVIIATNSLLPYSLSARELGNRKEVQEKIEALAGLLVRGLVIE